MKTCPQCGSVYDERVDYCFRDGAVLVAGGASVAPAPLDEFDRPLPALAAPAQRTPPPLQAETFDASDLPEPGFLRQATDLPEPAGLSAAGLTQEETAAIPTHAPAPELPSPGRLTQEETAAIPTSQPAELVAELPAEPDDPPAAPDLIPTASSTPAPEAPDPEADFFAEDGAGEPAFREEPLPLPQVQELDGLPEQTEEEEEDRAAIPWMWIGVAAVVLLLLGGGFAMLRSPGGPQGETPALDPATAGTTAANEPVEPIADAEPKDLPKDEPGDPTAADDGTDASPVVQPATQENTASEPAVADVQHDLVERPEPRVEPLAADPTAAPEPVQRGVLHLSASPRGATLFVDGERVGVAPTQLSVAHGRHTVRAEANGYKPVQIIVTMDGTSATSQLTLVKDVASRQVMLYGPPGARSVHVAGQSINTLPASIELPLGYHSFVVVKSDGTSFSVTEQVSETGSKDLVLLAP